MPGHIDNYVSKQEKELAKDIDRIYRQAAREVRQKLKDFTEHHKAKNALLKKRVKEGTLSEEAYKNWLKGQVFQSEQWQRKLDDIVKVYRNADEKAREIVGGTSKNIFCEAANYTAFSIEKDLMGAISFNLYDKKTVERLIKDNPKMLPEWKINETKDYVWNEKRVQNAVAQGIIQGESIAQIGNRLTGELATSNAKKMNLFARTAFTGAQNAGRIDRLHDAEEMGIEVKKKWLASLDDRTRDAHADLDGDEVPVDEPFHSILGPIMYPGDPTADPANVYNCRCTLTYVYPKYQHLQQNHQRYDQKNKELIQYKTYRQWEKWKKGEPEPIQKEIELPDDKVMQGIAKTDKTGYKETAEATNPNYSYGNDYKVNCSCCVVANEMRARGYDVTADIARGNMRYFWYDIESNVGKGSWTDCFNGINSVAINATRKSQQIPKIVELMKEYGNNSRAVVFVQWNRGGGHYFTVQNVNGEIKFTNPQNVKSDAESFFEYSKPSKTRIFRVDNLRATEYVREAVVGVKNK